jgi:hypothetical protein
MDFVDAGYRFLEGLQVHFSPDNPFQGSDNEKTQKQFELMEEAAGAVKRLLLHMSIEAEMRAKVEAMKVYAE